MLLPVGQIHSVIARFYAKTAIREREVMVAEVGLRQEGLRVRIAAVPSTISSSTSSDSLTASGMRCMRRWWIWCGRGWRRRGVRE